MNLESVSEETESSSPGFSAAEIIDSQPPNVAELRLQKMREYLVEALGNPNCLAANLRALTFDLMMMAFRLQQAIETALNEQANPLERFDRLMPAIGVQLKITHQVDRLTQLDRLVLAARQSQLPPNPW